MFVSYYVQFLPSFLSLSPWALPSVKTSIVGSPTPTLAPQPVACSAVLGHKPHFPWGAIMLALGFAQSGASPGVWHAMVHCCKQKQTYTKSIPSATVPDGWRTVMLPGPNHLLQLGDRVPQL